MRLISIVLGIATLFAISPAMAEYAKLSDDLTIYYEQSGQGPQTIVFIPGWTMSTKVFERQLKHFADSKQFRAISYDPRGQGLSSKTLDGHTYQQHGRDLAAFIKKLDLNNIVIAGWSFGVLEMMAYINQFGIDKVKAVIVIDGSPKGLGKDNTKEWVWYSYDDNDKSRESNTMDTLEDRPRLNVEMAEWVLEAATPENIRWVDNIANQTPNFIAALTNETGAYTNYEQDLKELYGKRSMLFVVSEDWKQIVTDWVKLNAPDVELVVMGKHLMFWERSREFNTVLDRFLSRLK